jgi:hypothetical protein
MLLKSCFNAEGAERRSRNQPECARPRAQERREPGVRIHILFGPLIEG